MTAQTPDECFYNGKIYYPYYLAKRTYLYKDELNEIHETNSENRYLAHLTDDIENPMMGDWDVPKDKWEWTNLHRKRVGHFQLHDDLRLQIHALTRCPKVKDDNPWLEWHQTYQGLDWSEDHPKLIPEMFNFDSANIFKNATFINYEEISLFENPLLYEIMLMEQKKVLKATNLKIEEIDNPFYDKIYDKTSPFYFKNKRKTLFDKIKQLFL